MFIFRAEKRIPNDKKTGYAFAAMLTFGWRKLACHEQAAIFASSQILYCRPRYTILWLRQRAGEGHVRTAPEGGWI